MHVIHNGRVEFYIKIPNNFKGTLEEKMEWVEKTFLNSAFNELKRFMAFDFANNFKREHGSQIIINSTAILVEQNCHLINTES